MYLIVNREAGASTAPIPHTEWPLGRYDRALNAPASDVTMMVTPSLHLAAAAAERHVRQSCMIMWCSRKYDGVPCFHESLVPLYST